MKTENKLRSKRKMATVDTECEFAVEIRDAPPAHLLTNIESFSKLWTHGIQKQESREFVALETINGKARRFNATDYRWGFSISKSVLSSGYLVDDKCAFGAEVFVSAKTRVNECLSLLDWKIPNFSKLKGVWNSEEFLAGGLRWKMKLFPNGNCDAIGKSVSLYLECVEAKNFSSDEKVKADLCIRIKNKVPHANRSKNTSHWFSSRESDWGFNYFIPISDMSDPSKGFIINDCCFLETQLSVQDVVKS